MQTFLLYYLGIGVLIVCVRVGYDFCARVATSARNIVAMRNISMLRATLTLIICGTGIVCAMIMCWPGIVHHFIFKRARK